MLESHPKSTLIAVAKTGYLKGLPRFTQERIGKFIKTEEAMEAARGHEVDHNPIQTRKVAHNKRDPHREKVSCYVRCNDGSDKEIEQQEN